MELGRLGWLGPVALPSTTEGLYALEKVVLDPEPPLVSIGAAPLQIVGDNVGILEVANDMQMTGRMEG